MQLKKALEAILNYILLPFTAISFILTPLTNDTRIFIAAESVADKFYGLPYGWDAAYEVKPIGNRIVNWVLYKFADFVIPFTSNHYAGFGYMVKIAGLLILVGCCIYIARKIKFPYAFQVLFIAFACQANFGIMMSEWFSVLFSLVAIALCFEEDKRLTVAGGAMAFSIALLKSITGLMVVPIICGVYLLDGKLHWKEFIAGYIAAGIAFLVLCLTVWPYSIGDMLMSRLIAHVGKYGLDLMLQWFFLTQQRANLIDVFSFYVPILVVGAVAGVLVAFYLYHKNSKHLMALLVVCWLVPVLIVFIQSEFIVYHYIVIMLPSLISIAIVMRRSNRRFQFLAAALLFVFVGYILVNSAFGSFTAFEYGWWKSKEDAADVINAKFDLINQSSVLYLDPGDALYYFHANSSCHYITPMPVERSTDEWNISYLPQFAETYGCIKDYSGEYIVAGISGGMKQNYYGKGILMRPELINHIHDNYTLELSYEWDIYKKKS